MNKTLRFTVNRPPVSTNKAYATTRSGGFYTSKEAKEFKEAVKEAAALAKHNMCRTWPKIEDVKQVYVEIVTFNTKHDCSAAEKFVLDAMEGVVYKNDKVAHPRFNDIAQDKGLKRVEVMVELLK